MKVYNLEGPSGRAVVNQFVIKDGDRKVFQSYDRDCSRTTSKYFKIFLMDEVGFTDEEVEQIKKELRKGHNYILVNRFIIHYCEDMR